MDFHPYSEIFPLIEGAALDELSADIKEHGLREDIWLYEGKILDGRNRFLACEKAKVRPVYRKYLGKEPLSFVVSLNMQRRHLTHSQRAMAAARIATLRHGTNQHTSKHVDISERPKNSAEEVVHTAWAASSQSAVAESLGVSTDSVQRARKVVDSGSKALQRAVETGEISVKKAAAVVDLPKAQQLAEAKKKPEPKQEPALPPEADDAWEPDENEDEGLALAEQELAKAIDKVMASDDRLTAAHAEIKRLTTENAGLRLARDGYMNGKQTITKMLKTEQSKVTRLKKDLKKAADEIESLRERVAIMSEDKGNGKARVNGLHA
jgi:hypothetical protein